MKVTNTLILILCIMPSIAYAQVVKEPPADLVIYKIDPRLKWLTSLAKDKSLETKPTTTDITQIVEDAQRLVDLGKAESDPRYISYASSLVESVKSSSPHSVELNVVRADILQYQHRFDEALLVLNKVINLQPQSTRARLMRATIYQSQNKHRLALQDCKKLLGKAQLLVAITCITESKSHLGGLNQAYATLDASLNRIALDFSRSHGDNLMLSWSYSVLFDLALRVGNVNAAELAYKKGMEANPSNLYLITMYADYLLVNQKFPRFAEHMQNNRNKKGLLVWQAIAHCYVVPSSRCDQLRQELTQRYRSQAQMQRVIHYGEQALYFLYVDNNPLKAYQYAKRNWLEQKSISDAYLLIRCAMAVDNQKEYKNISISLKDIAPFDPRRPN